MRLVLSPDFVWHKMIIDALPQFQQSHSLRSSGDQPKPADESDNPLPSGNLGANVDVSESGRLALEREMENIAQARENNEFVDFRGHDGKIRLGLFALGKSTIDDWSAKGLELTEKSVLAAAEAYQDASRKIFDENGSSTAGSGMVLNRHQIIIESQAVPDWFMEEYESTLLSMDNSKVKDAFENGDTFFVSHPSVSNSEALSRYADVKHSR